MKNYILAVRDLTKFQHLPNEIRDNYGTGATTMNGTNITGIGMERVWQLSTTYFGDV